MLIAAIRPLHTWTPAEQPFIVSYRWNGWQYSHQRPRILVYNSLILFRDQQMKESNLPTIWVFSQSRYYPGESCVCLGWALPLIRFASYAVGDNTYTRPYLPATTSALFKTFQGSLYRCRYQRCICRYFHPSGPYCHDVAALHPDLYSFSQDRQSHNRVTMTARSPRWTTLYACETAECTDVDGHSPGSEEFSAASPSRTYKTIACCRCRPSPPR